MKYVAIIHKAQGNETVGTTWHETYVFDEDSTLQEVFSVIGFLNQQEVTITPVENSRHV